MKATIHWVPAQDSILAEVRLYNQLFTKPEFDAAKLSLEVLTDARIEPALAQDNSPEPVQFERLGYFCRDKDSASGRLVLNRTVGLRDTFAKVVGSGQ